VQTERNLQRLLADMAPSLAPREFVFATFPGGALPVDIDPVGTFREAEGLSAIIERAAADGRGVAYGSVFRCITLTVHSSLEAVGFFAEVARVLAAAGIPCNAVSAFHHDHLFVPAQEADRALELLRTLAASATGSAGHSAHVRP
jgi:uncharacterized protein